MKNSLIVAGIMLILGVVIIPVVWSDDDHDEWLEYSRRSTGVELLINPVYNEECGDCHMAYPPGLLPAASWQRVMSGLEHHFGDNAELDDMSYARISDFLAANSADKSDYRRSRRFAMNYNPGNVHTRISETSYFKHEHDEIPTYLVTGNKEVNSFSNCNTCHLKAEQASFRERDIFIPGYGRWDD